MAGLKEIEKWEAEIYRIEESDPVHGGEEGVTNKPTKQLANRTLYLKKLLEAAGQKLNPKPLNATTTNHADEEGHTHEIALGSTSQKGLVQLTNETSSDSEALALTAKAGKKLAQEAAQIRLHFSQNYIQNNKKSSAVDSTSDSNIATSLAVKTAYDKGVAAENNANNRVAKSGDEMTGSLTIKGRNNQAHSPGIRLINEGGGTNTASHVDYYNAQNRYPQAGIHFVDRGGHAVGAAVLTTPEGSDFNSDRRQEHTKFDPNGSLWVRSYGYLHERFTNKNGDVMPWLEIKRGHAWLTVKSESNNLAGTDLVVQNGVHPQVSYVAVDKGSHGVAAEIWTTPFGNSYRDNRRETHTNFHPDGYIWNKNYGWLHDKFHHSGKDYLTATAGESGFGGIDVFSKGIHYRMEIAGDRFKWWKENAYEIFMPERSGTVALIDDVSNLRNDIHNQFIQRSDCIRTWYPHHYQGAEVYKIRHLGLMIIVMDVGTGNQGVYNLPEAFDGFAIPMITDNGGARNVGARMEGNNRVYLYGGNTISRGVIVIGSKNV